MNTCNIIVGGITCLDFKLLSKAIVCKTVWYLYQNRYIDQWKVIDTPGINPCVYGQMTFDKDSKNTQLWKDSFLSK